MKKGDLALVYHTGDVRAAVGVAEVRSAPYPDPKARDDKLVVVDLKPKKELASPVTLPAIKADKTFDGWDFLRIGRLSVVPVPDKMWARILELSEEQ
jgi:predicted RNA-binding protein with PUA-like domain